MTTQQAFSRFTTLPHDNALAHTAGSSVMTDTSVTLPETGIAAAVDEGDLYRSARARMARLDCATELQVLVRRVVGF